MAVDGVGQAYAAIAGFDFPNPMQERVWGHVRAAPWGVGLLLKAPTGSGKTEAIAVPALAAGDRRLIMVYPARSLVDDQVGRFQRILARCSEGRGGRVLTLVVDTGAESRRYAWKDGRPVEVEGNSRRHLYHGDVIVTTLDKFLYRFFGFGEPAKSYIYPLRIHYGARRTLVCFDEAHAYDDVAFSNFARLVRTLFAKGVDVGLMTATMPPEFAAEFGYLEQIDFVEDPGNREVLTAFAQEAFPDRAYPGKRLTYMPAGVEAGTDAESPALRAMIALAEQRAAPRVRIVVTAERVRDAVAIYRAVQSSTGAPEVLLYHGRLTSERRKRVYQRLLELERAQAGYLLISTSAIEVGCDLNAHLLITQLCDPERLIQRAGRCNRRHEMPDAEVIVVGDTVPAWLTGLRPDDLEAYRRELARQDGGTLDAVALAHCIRKHPSPDYRVEMMFDMLYEYVYDARLENKGLHERGLVVTRSWEPSLTLCTGRDASGRLLNAVEVPMASCVARETEPITANCRVYREGFDWREHVPTETPLDRWACGYNMDLVVETDAGGFDETEGYVELPRVFDASYASGYRRQLLRVEDGVKKWVWFIEPLRARPHVGVEEEPEKEAESEEGGSEDAD